MSGKILDLALQNEAKLLELGALLPYQADGMKAAVKVLANEPARYFYEESDQEYWDQAEEFQNVAPPFQILWLEWASPRFMRSKIHGVRPWPDYCPVRTGALLTAFDESMLPHASWRERFPGAAWVVNADFFMLHEDPDAPLRGVPFHSLTFRYGVLPTGRLVTVPPSSQDELDPSVPLELQKGIVFTGEVAPFVEPSVPPGTAKDFSRAHIPSADIALLSVYLMHSKGSELKTERVDPALRKARQRRGDAAADVVYKTLDIGLPARRSIEDAKRQGGDFQAAMRLHLRRGGFAVYSPERPHVSGYVGSMWRRPTVVGSERRGTVVKDYKPTVEQLRDQEAREAAKRLRRRRKKR